MSFLTLWPGAVYLLRKIPGELFKSKPKIFLLVLIVIATATPIYNACIDAPMYLGRYHADEAANKTYFKFFDGLKDAAVRRHPTQKTEDWEADEFWMGIYFIAGPFTAMYVMSGPRYQPTYLEMGDSNALISDVNGRPLLAREGSLFV